MRVKRVSLDPKVEAQREHEMRQAFLLHQRGQDKAALKLLAQLKQGDSYSPEVEALEARILSNRETAKERRERHRDLRFRFGLHTTSGRLWTGFLSLAAIVGSLWMLIVRIGQAFQFGLMYEITTTWRSRSGSVTPFTRALYWDILGLIVLLLVAGGMLYMAWKLSKDAEDWEELVEVDNRSDW